MSMPKCAFQVARKIRATDKEDSGCAALITAKGCGQDCSFFATAAQVKQSRDRANAHLRDLPDMQQKYISETYYRGKKPWQDQEKKKTDGVGNGNEM